jgi:hypothetical protein
MPEGKPVKPKVLDPKDVTICESTAQMLEKPNGTASKPLSIVPPT